MCSYLSPHGQVFPNGVASRPGLSSRSRGGRDAVEALREGGGGGVEPVASAGGEDLTGGPAQEEVVGPPDGVQDTAGRIPAQAELQSPTRVAQGNITDRQWRGGHI